MKDNQLEVGDKIILCRYGNHYSAVEIDRVTPKQAFVGSTKFKRELESLPAWRGGGLVPVEIGRETWSQVSYEFYTPERWAVIAQQEYDRRDRLRLRNLLGSISVSEVEGASIERVRKLADEVRAFLNKEDEPAAPTKEGDPSRE